MPIYEYRCPACGLEFQTLIMKPSEEKGLSCPECGNHDLHRLISSVAYHLSEGDRLRAFDPASRQPDGFYRDSRNIGLSAQKRARRMGVDLGDGFREKLEKVRSNPGSVFDEKG